MQSNTTGKHKIIPLKNQRGEFIKSLKSDFHSSSIRKFKWCGNRGDFFSIHLEFKRLEDKKAYRKFISENYKLCPYHICVSGAICAVLLTRIANKDSNTSFSTETSSIQLHDAALALSIFVTILIAFYMILNSLEYVYAYSFKICRRINSFIAMDDVLLCMTVATAGINIISSALYFNTPYQEQLELIIFIYAAPFILPMFFRKACKYGILFGWIISFVFLSIVEVSNYHIFPYVTLVGEIVMFLSIYEKERDRMLTFDSYLVARQKFGIAKQSVKKMKDKWKRESLNRKLNDALVHEMLPRKVSPFL